MIKSWKKLASCFPTQIHTALHSMLKMQLFGVKSMYYKAALFVTVSPNKGQQMKLGTVAEKSKSENSLVKDKTTQEHITVHKLRVAANVLI